MSIVDDIKRRFQTGGIVIQLIMVNAGVFILMHLIGTVFVLSGMASKNTELITPWLSIPASLQAFLLKPWTIITYMFTHEGLMHIAFNMLMLYWFGQLFVQLFDRKQLLNVYILGGIAGALLYQVSFNLLPFFEDKILGSSMIGASAAVMAIVVAVATRAPELELQLLLLGRIKLKYIAIGYIVIDLIQTTGSNSGGHISHLGGALAGYLFVHFLKTSNFDLSGWIGKVTASISGIFTRKEKSNMKVKWKRPVTDQEFRNERAASQSEIDEILEKIKRSGYASLSSKEKQKLFEASKK